MSTSKQATRKSCRIVTKTPVPPQVEPPKVKPRKVKPRKVKPRKVKPPKVKPAKVKPPKVNAAKQEYMISGIRNYNHDEVNKLLLEMFEYRCEQCEKTTKVPTPLATYEEMTEHFEKEHKGAIKYAFCRKCSMKITAEMRIEHIKRHNHPVFDTCYKCRPPLFAHGYQRADRSIFDLAARKKLEKEFACQKCGSNDHYRPKNPNPLKLSEYVLCQICGKNMKRNIFSFHMKRLHPEKEATEEERTCKICGKISVSKIGLYYHNKNYHGTKIYSCPKCDYTTKVLSCIIVHKKQKHPEPGADSHPFKCIICQKVFRTKPVFSDHMKQHKNERNLKCEFCPATFNISGSLSSHRRTKHPEEYAKWKASKKKDITIVLD